MKVFSSIPSRYWILWSQTGPVNSFLQEAKINTLAGKHFSTDQQQIQRGLPDEAQGEVTHLFTMILVSIMTLSLVVVESARETGQIVSSWMAADSLMDW